MIKGRPEGPARTLMSTFGLYDFYVLHAVPLRLFTSPQCRMWSPNTTLHARLRSRGSLSCLGIRGLLRMSSVHGWWIDTAFYPELLGKQGPTVVSIVVSIRWADACLKHLSKWWFFAFPDQLCSPVEYWTFRICITKRRRDDQVAVPWRSRPATITTMMLWNGDASIGIGDIGISEASLLNIPSGDPANEHAPVLEDVPYIFHQYTWDHMGMFHGIFQCLIATILWFSKDQNSQD